MLMIIGLALGVLLGLYAPFYVTPTLSPYVAIAIIAALDTVFGGITATFSGKFKLTVFITGFFVNALLAAGLSYLGNLLGIDLLLAAIVVFGTRMFQNLATIRRYLIDKYI